MNTHQTPLERLHESVMRREAARRQQKLVAIYQKPGYDSNQTISMRDQERAG